MYREDILYILRVSGVSIHLSCFLHEFKSPWNVSCASVDTIPLYILVAFAQSEQHHARNKPKALLGLLHTICATLSAAKGRKLNPTLRNTLGRGKHMSLLHYYILNGLEPQRRGAPTYTMRYMMVSERANTESRALWPNFYSPIYVRVFLVCRRRLKHLKEQPAWNFRLVCGVFLRFATQTWSFFV